MIPSLPYHDAATLISPDTTDDLVREIVKSQD